MINRLAGTGVALVTPFDQKGEVDFTGLGNLLDYTSQNGVDYWVVQGTTGESATCTREEKAEILNFVKKNNPKNLPIVYGIGGNNTSNIIREISETDFEGVDGLLSVSPYYNKPSQEGLAQHYTAIADHSPVPVIIYNVPGRTASNVSADTTVRLASHPNIAGVKEASNDLPQCIKIRNEAPDDFMLISGDDLITLPLISIGASGVISVLANAIPGQFSRMVHDALEGKWESARKMLYKISEINPLMYSESNPVGVKQALNYLGVCGNHVRLPLVPASANLQEKINGILKELFE